MSNKKARNIFITVCISPAIILFILFMVVPTVEVFRMSMYSWGGFSNTKEFVGFDNFKVLWNDAGFIQSFQNSVLLIVLVAMITIVFALFFAALLTKENLKGNNFFRIIFYIPNILSIVVIAGIFSAVYDPESGLLNSVFDIFSLESMKQMWLGNQSIVIYSVAGALVWQAIGYYMVMYMSSMASIPASYYEAASLEGAGKLKQFTSITLPLIWNNIRTTLTFYIISTINLSFLLVKAMTGGGPDGSTEVFLSYMYAQAYGNSTYGYGMAIGVVVFLFSFALAAIVSHITKRDVLEY
ncbi:carbohydrate ABC transporter permease [Virgibacillus halodenitrificans]|uniref:ABC transporter permease n=2 Tax=Virgibacillus halodenitrificans TaxID=1482 RepID=A0AAC9J4I2_VIRHA|nr:sugar ABC transporter permease [Virgibacillus halodenitrificans]APC49319.1 ABC transporter permease [Virgibacillus halodenitrificans]MCJ0930047.1 sugar ABC transporter permease [Virgibacillus halodenitrificans]MEC2158327.1 sugar ABC transporter permease [Virgibacillus halodenitrificans]MYL46776.1 ABC transporter permease subunit [Virgibacillus halodenitrificans]MYL59235.1 ABC transporter permease subunit [Virgibacillus halodenitrificans]